MKILSFFLLLSKLVFAQYDSTMYDLIKTTYERSFDKQIISNYLTSDKDYKIRAAILSIAQSEDTLFVPDLLNLDLNKFGSEVCFALAQIGECNKSTNFLWNYLRSSPPPKHFPKIFFAIGKIGNANDLQSLIEFYNSFDGPIFPLEGISNAILQFQLRGIKNDEAKNILETEITSKLSSDARIALALFTLVRYGGTISIQKSINDFLLELNIDSMSATNRLNSIDFDTKTKIRQFSLMNLASIKVFPLDVTYFARIPKMNPFNRLIQILCAKAFVYYDFEKYPYSDNWIGAYLNFLESSNPNVAIQSAISVRFLNRFSVELYQDSIKHKIDELLFDSTKSLSFKGELFLSRFGLFGNYEEHLSLLNKIHISKKYKFDFYSKNPNPELAFKKLFESYSLTSCLRDQIDALPFIIGLQNKVSDTLGLKMIFFNALSYELAPNISITADGIDSILIAEYSDQLKEIISNQINKHKDNSNFLEATMSLVNLAEKIDKDFYSQIIEKVKTSKLYSIRKFVADKTGEKVKGLKELEKFEDISQNAFKYKHATITTSKGNIVIKFDSEIAPISVANFCMLAKQNFYNGILFHRVVPGFVIQAGDPTATGWGGPGYDIVSEYSDTNFDIGYVGMASAGKDTESSQFFIMQGCYPHLDSKYTLFAKVVEGIDVVYNITEEDKIISIDLK